MFVTNKSYECEAVKSSKVIVKRKNQNIRDLMRKEGNKITPNRNLIGGKFGF